MRKKEKVSREPEKPEKKKRRSKTRKKKGVLPRRAKIKPEVVVVSPEETTDTKKLQIEKPVVEVAPPIKRISLVDGKIRIRLRNDTKKPWLSGSHKLGLYWVTKDTRLPMSGVPRVKVMLHKTVMPGKELDVTVLPPPNVPDALLCADILVEGVRWIGGLLFLERTKTGFAIIDR